MEQSDWSEVTTMVQLMLFAIPDNLQVEQIYMAYYFTLKSLLYVQFDGVQA